MFPAPFDYVRASSVEEAIGLLARYGEDGKVLAGGHSLLPLMKLRLSEPKTLIDVGRLAALRGIKEEASGIVVGALTTYATIERSSVLATRLPALTDAASVIGDWQVRNRGTIGGSLAHADPAADLPVVVVALGAEIRAIGSGGGRAIPADDFFVDLLTTALQPGELLAEIRVPLPRGRASSAYAKHPHPASRYSIVGCAAAVAVDDGGRCQAARVVLGGVANRPTRAAETEQALIGQRLDASTIQAAAARASAGLNPPDDLAASGEYRAHLATVYARRALARVVERLGR